ncbi:MAG: hypothetical protein RI563_11390, partial [Thiohalophilus sp.]|uniref:hypothetical protein n=1 Tax=Thiohalophilus sp. TaxID=3028392 RepID=UPI00286FD5AF
IIIRAFNDFLPIFSNKCTLAPPFQKNRLYTPCGSSAGNLIVTAPWCLPGTQKQLAGSYQDGAQEEESGKPPGHRAKNGG